MDSLRTFVAIELPEEVRALVTQHINRLRRELPDVRASWSREDNLHLTLKFLGNVPVADITKVSEAIGQSAAISAPFELLLSECGSFPPHGRPRVLWIGLGRQASGLHALHHRIEANLAAAGFPPESRAFHPHLTIARLRSSQGARGLADLHQAHAFVPASFTVSEIVVFRSELLKEGSRHTPISRHRLQ